MSRYCYIAVSPNCVSIYLKLLEINEHFDKSILKSPHIYIYIYISLFKNLEYIL